MKKLLCYFGLHKWNYKYWFDNKVKWPRFKIDSAQRICKRCNKKQWSKPDNESHKIRYEKTE